MIISLKKQAMNSRIPLNCVSVYTGSALVLEITHLRMFADLGTLKQVIVEVTNVDGVTFTAEAALIDGTLDHYGCSFGAADFGYCGFVSKGVKITLMISPSDDFEVVSYVAGVGDLEVLKVRDEDKPTTAIDPLEDPYNLKQVKEKVNEIITAIAGKSACLVAAVMLAFGAGAAEQNAVYKASLEDLMNDAQVVTNVTFGDVTVTETDPKFDKWKKGTTIVAGADASAGECGVAIGVGASALDSYSVAIGNHATAYDSGVAIGSYAEAPGGYAVAFAYSPSAVYFGADSRNRAGRKSLQDYLDAAGSKAGETETVTALEYNSDGTAIAISVGANGVMTVALDGWVDGQAQTAFITLATGATVNSSIKLVGYADWPRDGEFAASVLRRGDKVYVIPLFGVVE